MFLLQYNIMDKYSIKLVDYLTQHNKDNKFNSNYEEDIFINGIIDKFNKIQTQESKQINTYNLPKIHNNEQPPLTYILFKQMYDNNLIKNYFKFVPDFNIFSNFVEWYRIHQHMINIRDIEKEVKNKLNNYVPFANIKSTESRYNLHEILYDNNFVSLDVQQYVEINDMICETYEYDNLDIKIVLYYVENSDKPDLNLIVKIIQFMKIISGDNTFVDLTILYTKQQKRFNRTTKIFCPNNINSGSTYAGHSITIWRAEELYKVLIHEMVHYVHIDFSRQSDTYKLINGILLQSINIEGNDVVNESYTEIVAIFLHTIIMSILTNNKFTELIHMEMTHSCFQLAKIICLFGGSSYDDLFKITIRQTTSVCSYFIAKSLLLFNFTDVMKFWKQYGLKVDDKNSDNYVKLYKSCLDKAKNREHNMVQYINCINMFIKCIKKSENKDDFISTTLRMSCLQIK